MLCSWHDEHTLRPIPNNVRKDMEHWWITLLSFTETRLIPNLEPTEIGWVGNALTSYRIGVLIGQRWAQFTLLEDWQSKEDQEPRIAQMETITIRLGLVMLKQLGIRKGKTFINVWTDNTKIEGAIHKCKSKVKEVNQEWKTIHQMLVKLEADLVAKRSMSKENKADALSRGE
jgi:hypothetical protein